jgi:peptide/nickel transport system ATP-binding protein
VLNLLQDLQEQRKLTYMFVTHNLSVVRHISDEICVMYLGQVAEQCPTLELFERPLHPYTRALLSAIPSADVHCQNEREILQGELASPINPKPGCRFASRCKYAEARCAQHQSFDEVVPRHFVACCRARELFGNCE